MSKADVALVDEVEQIIFKRYDVKSISDKRVPNDDPDLVRLQQELNGSKEREFQSRTLERAEKITELYNQGLSTIEVARKLRISPDYLRQQINKFRKLGIF